MISAKSVRAVAIIWLLAQALCCLPPRAAYAQRSAANEITERLQLAEKLQQQGETVRADSEYRQVLGLTLEQLGVIYNTLGDMQKAELAYRSAIEIKVDSDGALLGLGVVCLRKREFERGVEAVKALLAQKPFHAVARHLLGKLYFGMGRFDLAASELEEAARLEPDDYGVTTTLAMAYLKQGRADGAKKLLSRMLVGLGESARLHIFFGGIYRQTDLLDDAIAEFKRAVALDPRFPRAHYYLGLSYLTREGRNKIPEAVAEFQAELERDPNDYHTNYLLGVVYLNERKLQEAIGCLEKATKVNPQSTDALLHLGQAYFLSGDGEKAAPILRRAIELTRDPSRNDYQIANAHYSLSQALRRQGKTDEAAAHAALAAQYKARSAKSEAERLQLYLKGNAAGPDELKNGATGATAAGATGAAVVVEPEPPDGKERSRLNEVEKIYSRIAGNTYNRLGLLSASQSDFKRAARYFEQAALWDSSLKDADYNAALAHFRAENYGQAIAPLLRTRTKQPDLLAARVLLGLSYFYLDDYARAVEQLSPLADAGVNDPQMLFALGLSLAYAGDRQRGIKILHGLLEKYPGGAELHLALGRVSALEGDYPGAASEFSKALEINPSLPDAHYYAGLSLLRQSKFAEAAEEFRKEAGRNPLHAKAQYHLGFALVALQQTEEGIKRFEEAARLDPSYADAYYEMGKARLQQGRTDEAIKLLERAVELDSTKSYRYYQLSQAYLKAGRASSAQEAMSRYQQLKASERANPK